ncbi:MAG: hypothetical protein N3A55_03600 [Methylohalobius sp.]|nr:hypothetical protein [Methylohalobius sp.]
MRIPDHALNDGFKISLWLAVPAVLAFLLLTVLLAPKKAVPYFAGEKVLANCRDVYLLGTVEKVRTSGYGVHFGPEAQPILCANYLWRAEFLESYQPVLQVDHEGTSWQVGDWVELTFLVEGKKRLVRAKIADLTASGKARLSDLDGEPLAVAYFQSAIGKNYLSLGAYSMRKL